MDSWRELAIRHLPHITADIKTAESHVDLWQVFKEKVSKSEGEETSRETVESIFGYAWWCFSESTSPILAAEVATFFYEDLPMYSDFENQIPRFITLSQFARLEPIFQSRLTVEQYAEFRSSYFKKRELYA